MNQVKNRIVRSAEVAPDQLVANPLNFRIHPIEQRQAVELSMTELGWMDRVKVQDGTDLVVDGHLRVAIALSLGEETVPVDYLDLTDDEANAALAIYDQTTSMAGIDEAKRAELLASLPDTETVRSLLESVNLSFGFGGGVKLDGPEAPEEFAEYGEDIAVEHQCPRCGYVWSGGN